MDDSVIAASANNSHLEAESLVEDDVIEEVDDVQEISPSKQSPRLQKPSATPRKSIVDKFHELENFEQSRDKLN